MWGPRPATTRLLPWTYSQWKQMGWGAQWQIIVIMVTQWGRVMENVPCEMLYHGSFSRENSEENQWLSVQKVQK